MKKIVTYSMSIALAVFVSASVYAQPGEPGFDPERRKEQLKERILQHKHERLREVLNLDEETAKKFFDVYTPAEEEMTSLVTERNAMEIKLLKLTQGDYTDADVDPTFAEIERLNDMIKSRFMKLNDSLKPILNPRQRARLAVFEHQFNKKIRERIREHRRDRRGPHRPGEPHGDRPPKRRGPMDRDHGPR